MRHRFFQTSDMHHYLLILNIPFRCSKPSVWLKTYYVVGEVMPAISYHDDLSVCTGGGGGGGLLIIIHIILF